VAARRALLFELGCAYEASGKNDEAVQQYMLVSAEDPKFRDVQERIDRLGGPRAVAAVAKPAPQRTAAAGGMKAAAQAARPAATASKEPSPEPARKNRKIGFV
jgi:hypothetical protein